MDERASAAPPDPGQPADVGKRCPAGIVRMMVHPRIVRSSLAVSAVVGTLLNLVNNGDQLWTDHAIDPWRGTLNFLVPYLVSSYSAARSEARRARRD